MAAWIARRPQESVNGTDVECGPDQNEQHFPLSRNPARVLGTLEASCVCFGIFVVVVVVVEDGCVGEVVVVGDVRECVRVLSVERYWACFLLRDA